MEQLELENSGLRLSARAEDGRLHMKLAAAGEDGLVWSDEPYMYRFTRATGDGTVTHERMHDLSIQAEDHAIVAHGTLGGLALEHRFHLPPDRSYLEEQLSLRHTGSEPIRLLDLEFGFQQRVADELGRVAEDRQSERFVAVPFRIRPSDPPGHVNDFSLSELLTRGGREQRVDAEVQMRQVPSRHHLSEGWAWTHGEKTLGIFKFSQEILEWSALTPMVCEDAVRLRFGGGCLTGGEPAVLTRLAPGQQVVLGVTRYAPVTGDYRSAYAAFRAMLDENGCRFPTDYRPPVHWNELYDNLDFGVQSPGTPVDSRNTTRHRLYTRAAMELEAAKAGNYHCEALYLDPGWDTVFGSFLWNEGSLGPRRRFIEAMRERFGLAVSLHCPLATWTTMSGWTGGCGYRDNASAWPRAAWRMDREGQIVEGSLCLGARQYLDEAERRLLDSCADGVTFLMFDGNSWNGGCWNPDHGHPVPYLKADHIAANMDLCRRIHARFPDVHIEMHDMLISGQRPRVTPIYYGYGTPGGYDCNWGFELMWNPIEDLRSGRAQALYYYNLGCNIPVYLHIDLRDDNEHCTVLWWFASTCRHLGIGGTHPDPMIVERQKLAMARYRRLDRFYKRGEFVGVNEEIHVHVLPEEQSCVVNIFNLNDAPRRIEGGIEVSELGLDPDRWYTRSDRQVTLSGGRLNVNAQLPPWGHQLVEITPA